MTTSASNPQRQAPFSPLSELVAQALRRFGDTSPYAADGELMLLFLDMANQVLEDVRTHPYWEPYIRPEGDPRVDVGDPGADLPYYIALEDIRPIPDIIMTAGLTAHYALQQSSQRTGALKQVYDTTMNRVLYNRRYGNASISVRPMDGGSNPTYARVRRYIEPGQDDGGENRSSQ